MDLPADLNTLSPEQLRALATQLIARVEDRDREIEGMRSTKDALV
ncbi:hypothetical protein [Paraburkholderia youngii]|nr:hypothetical protein [Paraburkholderia youngii]